MPGDFDTLSPQDSSDFILKNIKNSNLHFISNETPFSVYITLRKKFLNIPNTQNFMNGNQKSELSEVRMRKGDLIEENEILKAKVEQHEKAKQVDEEIIAELDDKLAMAKKKNL